MPTSSPSLNQLKRALEISEEIQKLEAELKAVLGGGESSGGRVAAAAPAAAKAGGRKRGKMSPEARERIAAAQRARWAKSRGGKPAKSAAAPKVAAKSAPAAKAAKPAKAGKRVLSPEARQRIIEAQKKRWANFRKGK